MLRFSRSGRSYVLRRGPRHLRPRSNSVILRETKVLAALAGSDVPHPHLIAACDDPGVLGDAVFYLMDPSTGQRRRGAAAVHAGDPSVRHGMGLSMADALAKWAPSTTSRWGSPTSASPRASWNARCRAGFRSWTPTASTTATPATDPRDRGSGVLAGPSPADELDPGDHARRLPRRQRDVLPDRTGCGRDRRLGDVHDRDPLLDLGWLLATWRQPDGSSVFSHALGGQDGLASTDELFERYAANTTRDLSHITWYTMLACFKLGIVIEGTSARACAGKAEKEVGDQLHAATVHLFQRALGLIEGERYPLTSRVVPPYPRIPTTTPSPPRPHGMAGITTSRRPSPSRRLRGIAARRRWSRPARSG